MPFYVWRFRTAFRLQNIAGAVRFAVGAAVKADEAFGGRVVRLRRDFARQFGQNGFGQLFAQFHAPLVEAVDAPYHALHENFVFV